MKFKSNQRVYYVHRSEGNKPAKLLGTIVAPGQYAGTWKVRLDDHRMVITANEGDLILLNERES
jgi:hypothetical protein